MADAPRKTDAPEVAKTEAPAMSVKTYPHIVARGHSVLHNGTYYGPGKSVPYTSDELEHANRLLASGHLRNPAKIASVSEEDADALEQKWNQSQKPSDGPSVQVQK